MEKKKPKLIFKKGIDKIVFPIIAPIMMGDEIKLNPRNEILKILNKYQPRKNIVTRFVYEYVTSTRYVGDLYGINIFASPTIASVIIEKVK